MAKYILSISILVHSFVFPAYADQFASFGFNKYALADSEKCILDRIKDHLGVSAQNTYLGIFALSGDSKVAVLNSYIGDDEEVTSCVVQFHSTDGWTWKNKNFHMVLETNTIDPHIDF